MNLVVNVMEGCVLLKSMFEGCLVTCRCCIKYKLNVEAGKPGMEALMSLSDVFES